MSNDKVIIEEEGFTAEVKETGDGGFQAKIRLEDDGIRGKNLVLHAAYAQGLADQLTALASAFTSTAHAVTNLATDEPDELPSDQPEQSQF